MVRQSGLYDYWMALYKRRLFIIIVTFSSAFFAYLLSMVFPPVFESKSSFYVPVSRSEGQLASLQSDSKSIDSVLLPIADEKSASVNIGILKSKDVAHKVIERFPGLSLSVGLLRRNVDIKLSGEFLIEVYVRDLDPKSAALIANAYPEVYREFHEISLRQRIMAKRNAYQAKFKDVTANLIVARNSLLKLQRKTGVTAPRIAEARFADLVRDLTAEYDLARVELVATDKRIEQLEAQLNAERANYKLGESVLTNPMIERLKEMILQLEMKLEGDKADVRASFPRLEETQAQHKKLKKMLSKEIEQLVESHTKGVGSIYEELRSSLITQFTEQKYLEVKKESIKRILIELEEKTRQLSEQYMEIAQLQGDIQHLSSIQQQIEQQLVDLNLQEGSISAAVVVEVERATVSDSPVFPKPVLNVIVGLVLGFVVGCYYALLLRYLNDVRRHRVMRKMDWTPIIKEP